MFTAANHRKSYASIQSIRSIAKSLCVLLYFRTFPYHLDPFQARNFHRSVCADSITSVSAGGGAPAFISIHSTGGCPEATRNRRPPTVLICSCGCAAGYRIFCGSLLNGFFRCGQLTHVNGVGVAHEGAGRGTRQSVDVLTRSRRDSAGGTPRRRGSAGAKHDTIYDCIRTVD